MPEIALESSRVRLTEIAHEWLDAALYDGASAVDATVGNGYDTLFLAHRVGEKGHVLGFDIQKAALTGAAELLRFAGVYNRVKLVLDDHANLERHLVLEQKITAGMFNLGYLPRGNRQIITRPETTVRAAEQLLARLSRSGRVTILAYRAHEGGLEEYRSVRVFLSDLPPIFSVREFAGLADSESTPRLFAIERRSAA
jgi:SAM-dependent methyltransferase